MIFIGAFIPANGAIDAAVTIAVLVIAFIGWLVQLAGQSKSPQAGPANRPRVAGQRPRAQGQNRPQGRPRDEKLQNEIDVFLRDVSSGRKPGSQAEAEEIAIEIIPEEEEEAPRRLVKSASPFAPSTEAAPPPLAGVGTDASSRRKSDRERERRQKRDALASAVAERHLEASPLGADLRRHVEQTMAESLQLRKEKEQAERSLAEARAELNAIRSQGGAGAARGAARAPAAKTSRFAELLKNAGTVKDAIVIGEVLGRPRGSHWSHR